MEKIIIETGRLKTKISGRPRAKYVCGIGDGIVDGLHGYGATQDKANAEFVRKFNEQNKFVITENRD